MEKSPPNPSPGDMPSIDSEALSQEFRMSAIEIGLSALDVLNLARDTKSSLLEEDPDGSEDDDLIYFEDGQRNYRIIFEDPAGENGIQVIEEAHIWEEPEHGDLFTTEIAESGDLEEALTVESARVGNTININIKAPDQVGLSRLDHWRVTDDGNSWTFGLLRESMGSGNILDSTPTERDFKRLKFVLDELKRIAGQGDSQVEDT